MMTSARDTPAKFTVPDDDRGLQALRAAGLSGEPGDILTIASPSQQVALEEALADAYGVASPYVKPAGPRAATLTLWPGHEVFTRATLGHVYRLFGRVPVRRVTVIWKGRTWAGLWPFKSRDFVNLRRT